MKSIFNRKAVLLILPLFYGILSCIFLVRVRHFYISDFDFSYPYLINGTNIASGHFRTGNLVHPGTPVEIFAAIVIFIKHLFTGNTVLYQDVLLHPESYLLTCSVVLAIFLSLATYFAGMYVYKHSRNILLALLFEASPLFFGEMVRRAVLLSAESSITIVGILFAAYLYVNTIRVEQVGKTTLNRNSMLFGLFSALLFTTKIYCLPIVLLVLLLVKRSRQRIIYLSSFGLFSVILVFPLYNQFRNWAGLVKSMIFHSGPYGQGDTGIINTKLYANNVIELFTNHYLFSLIYLLLVLAFLIELRNSILKKRAKIFDDSILPIAGILIFSTLFIIIITKQYRVTCLNPLTHTVVDVTKFYYFILLICCFPIAIAVSYNKISKLRDFNFFLMHKKKSLYIVAFIFAIFGLQQTFSACYESRNQNISFDETRQFLHGWQNTSLIIVSDGGDQIYNDPALLLGAYYSGKWDMPIYLDYLKKVYPNIYIYNIGWRDAITFWGDEMNISEVMDKSNKTLIYISGVDSLDKALTIERICGSEKFNGKGVLKYIYTSKNRYENIYLVKPDSLR